MTDVLSIPFYASPLRIQLFALFGSVRITTFTERSSRHLLFVISQILLFFLVRRRMLQGLRPCAILVCVDS